MKSTFKMTPNKITMLRVIIIPIFMFYAYDDTSGYFPLFLFLMASITDFVDGYIARKYNMVSTFGKFVDPLADKLLVLSALIIFVEQGKLLSSLVFIILAREFVITGLRSVLMEKGKVLAAGNSGKVKTCVQIIGISLLLTPVANYIVLGVKTTTIIGLIMTAVTVYSGFDYIYANRKLLKD